MGGGDHVHAPHTQRQSKAQPKGQHTGGLKLGGFIAAPQVTNGSCVVILQAGDMLYTASMVPIMKFVEDSGPGQHDTTAAACSYGMYALYLGEVGQCTGHLMRSVAPAKQHDKYHNALNIQHKVHASWCSLQEVAKEHDSCTNNLHNSLAELGLKLADDHRFNYYTPQPFNLWQNMSDEPDETGYIYAPPHPEQKAGDYCVFRAEVRHGLHMITWGWCVELLLGEGFCMPPQMLLSASCPIEAFRHRAQDCERSLFACRSTV